MPEHMTRLAELGSTLCAALADFSAALLGALPLLREAGAELRQLRLEVDALRAELHEARQPAREA